MNGTEWGSRFLAMWILANLIIITVWDVIVLIVGEGKVPTVSRFLYQWGRETPAVYLIMGIAVGHLVLPLVIPNGRP